MLIRSATMLAWAFGVMAALNCAAARADYISAVQALNPIDYWRFETSDRGANDGSSGQRVVNSNAVTGQLTGSALVDFAGPSSANGFAGFGETNNAIVTTSSAGSGYIFFGQYIPVAPGSAHTMNVWINLASTSGAPQVLWYGGTGQGARTRVRLQFEDGGKPVIDTDSVVIRQSLSDPNALSIVAGEWNMITFVVPQNATVNQAELYLNGQKLNTVPPSGSLLLVGGNGINLENASARNSRFDELTFFGTALNSEQIAHLYQVAVTGVPEPSGLGLIGMGLFGLAVRARKRRS